MRARTLDGALAALDADSKILAGGQSLVPMLNMRLVRPTRLVDINGVPGLAGVRARPDGGLVVGALTRHTDLLEAPLVTERAPLLTAATAHVGHRAIRNRGTVGGSLAHADPAAELPAALLALDASVRIAGRGGQRRVALEDFFVGALTTALASDEILIEIEIPDARRAAWGFAEVARRPGDFAIAGVAAGSAATRSAWSPAAPMRGRRACDRRRPPSPAEGCRTVWRRGQRSERRRTVAPRTTCTPPPSTARISCAC